MIRCIALFPLCLLLAACHRAPTYIEPTIQAPPHPKEIQREKRCYLSLPQNFSVSPFPPLGAEECVTEWGKEYQIALMFAEDFDLYRAITGFKRALFFLPDVCKERRVEIHYAITLAYFLGKKYGEASYSVESSELAAVDNSFPAYRDLLLILYESYEQTGKDELATHILSLIDAQDRACAQKLTFLSVVKNANFQELQGACIDRPYCKPILSGYWCEAKSVRCAEALNAFLPGAGYWYVGLKQTAITSFLVNGLFIAAATHFFTNGNIAAGVITLSLEGGWYFGGIYGAGLAAKRYNERVYCSFADKITQREQCFPILMLKYTF